MASLEYVNYVWVMFLCLEGFYSISLLSYSITTGALGSSGLLLSHLTILLALHISIILITTHLSTRNINNTGGSI